MLNPFAIIRRILTLPLYILFGARASGGSAGDNIPTLRLMEYQLYTVDDPNSPLLEMKGNYTGWQARVLRLLRILGQPYLRVTGKELRVSISQLSGTTTLVIPLSDITTSVCAIEKPARRLYFAVGILLVGVGAAVVLLTNQDQAQNAPIALGIAAFIAAVLAFSYWRSNRLVVAFSTADIDDYYGLAFSGGKTYDYDQLVQTIDRINRTITRAHLMDGGAGS